jgi:hypothetical protein
MMRQLFDSDLDLVIRSGFIHAPLLFDPSMDHEIHTHPEPDTLIRVNGRQFVRAVSLQSLLENYPTIQPESYEELRSACLQNYGAIRRHGRMPVGAKLRTILFHVMPHFIRGHRGLERGKLGEGEILDIIERNISLPARRYREAGELLDTGSLRRVLKELEAQGGPAEPARDGVISARELREWIRKAVERRVIDEERAHLAEILQQRKESAEVQRRHLALFLHIAEEGSLEIDGFGCCRIGATEEYYVYKHTGEYALRDFYGRIYLFPDCRVAIPTTGPFKPLVMEHYKHPFLEGHDVGQEICLRGFTPPGAFTAAAVIQALEEGISALLYGYSSRRRNGYHSLERLQTRVGSLGFGDSPIVGPTDYPIIRKGHILDVDFEDYRVAKDHPKIALGQVEVTNDLTP